MKVKIIEPHGYCMGVINAINIALKARKENPNKRVFVLGMLVHNSEVIDELKKKQIECLMSAKGKEDDLVRLKQGDVVIFTAHGHDEKLDVIAKEKGLIVYDATCVRVRNNMKRIRDAIIDNKNVIYIGQKGHPECEAALSISPKVSFYDTNLLGFNYISTSNDIVVVNQTTLNIDSLKEIHDEIKKHYPDAFIYDEICSSTRLRQEAVKNIENDCDLILIIGDKKSSNSNKLLEIAKSSHRNVDSYLINSVKEIRNEMLANKKYIVIASGASSSPSTINDVYSYLINL